MRRLLCTVCVMWFSAGGAFAQNAALSGTWSPTDTDDRHVWEISVNASAITLRVALQDREVGTATWTLGGARATKSFEGYRTSTSAALKGSVVEFRGTAVLQDGKEHPCEESWSIGANGVLTVTTKIEVSGTTLTRERQFARR